MKNILILPSWFPNKLHPLTGDFVERHAISASLYNRITVLSLVKDDRNNSTPKYHVEYKKYNDNLSAMILYYRPLSRFRAIEAVFSGLRYCIFLAEMIRDHIHQQGMPDILHVQVSWRAGLLALYCRWKYKLRYMISEHWTIFLTGAEPGFSGQNFIARKFIRLIYKKAYRCSAVSRQLAEVLHLRFNIPMPVVIPNVVDAVLFHPTESKNAVFRFIYVSEFNYQKNPEQVFEAASELKKRSADFELLVIAPDEEAVNLLAVKYDIADLVKFRGYIPHEVLALEMGYSDTLLLYSRFETFGCVVIEALSSGIPVIVSDIPVMHEIVDERSGVFVPLNNPLLLAEEMFWMMNNKHQFDPATLASIAAERYSFETVGKMFDEFYKIS